MDEIQNEDDEQFLMTDEKMEELETEVSSLRNTPYNKGFITFVAIIGSIGGFLFGYDTGIIAGAQLYFKDTWPEITTVERELTVSLALLGAFFGSLIAGPLSDAFGRKPVIIASDVLFTVGSIVMATAETIPILIIGRLIVGLAVGIASMIVPVYLSEVAPVAIRGTLVSIYIVFLTFGQFLSSIVALALDRNWRLMLGLGAVPAALQGLFMFFLPESQRWLGKKGRTEDCTNTLKRVYANQDGVAVEFESIQREMEKMRPYIEMTEWQRYKQLFTFYGRCLLVGCSLQAFQQLVGINTVMYYGPEIIMDSGVTIDGEERERTAIILNIPLAATNAIGSLIAVFFIDNLGRRWTMLRTLPVLFVALLLLSLSMYLSIYSDDEKTQNDGHIVFFFSIILYLAAFSIGFSATIWSVNTEIYPIHLVSTGVALATATNWLSNFAIASVFLTSMEQDGGKVWTFLILAFNALCAFIFIFFLLPETAGVSIRENVKNVLNRNIDREPMPKKQGMEGKDE